MAIELEFVDPISIPEWDEIVSSFPQANIFHTAGWSQTLRDSYRFTPVYALWKDENRPACIIPVIEINSVLTGKRGVSLPFTDLCPVITSGSAPPKGVLENLLKFGRSRGWKTVEFRGPGEEYVKEKKKIDSIPTYLVHELDLRPSKEDLLLQVRDSTRRNIRKAIKQGVEVVENNTLDGLKEFCRLNIITRREHGLPPQPPCFFHNLHKNIIRAGHGRILLAVHGGATVAGAVFLCFNGKAIYKYGASEKRYQSLRANNLLMWEAISRYAGERARSFHFGRTEPHHLGLLQFKRGWGAEERSMKYFKFSIPDGNLVSSGSHVDGLHTQLFSRLPLPVLDIIGRVLYRHMG